MYMCNIHGIIMCPIWPVVWECGTYATTSAEPIRSLLFCTKLRFSGAPDLLLSLHVILGYYPLIVNGCQASKHIIILYSLAVCTVAHGGGGATPRQLGHAMPRLRPTWSNSMA